MKPLVPVGISLAALLLALPALADDKASCVDAASKAQKLRNAHQLLEARDQLRVCAAAACPSVVQSDCVTWLADVERSIPAVVVTVKNGAGVDLIDVNVTVDGQPFMSRVTGQATPLDAGAHLFHFEGADGSLDQQVLVREGVKDQAVAVVLKPVGVGKAPAAAPPAAAVDAPASPPPTASGSPVRTAGWVLGGVGVAGLAVGVVGGILAVSDKSGANCAGDVCQGSVGGVKSAALASTVGFVAGGALVAGGAGILLFGPRGQSAPTTGLRLVPVFTANGGQMVVGGSF